MYEAEKRARRYERLYGQRVLKPLLVPLFKVAPAPEDGGIWLDWEAGSGLVTLALAERLPRDATLLVSEQDRAALRVLHSHPELDRDRRVFVRQDLPDELLLADATVDVCVAHWRWQYTAQPERALRELVRVAKRGGKLVVSFLQPGAGGSLHAALLAAGQGDVARALEQDGISSATVRECLRSPRVTRIEVRTFAMQVMVGASSRPMMDPLLLDFLLPRWLSRATGQEVTSVEEITTFDLGGEALAWQFKAGFAIADIESAEEISKESSTPNAATA